MGAGSTPSASATSWPWAHVSIRRAVVNDDDAHRAGDPADALAVGSRRAPRATVAAAEPVHQDEELGWVRARAACAALLRLDRVEIAHQLGEAGG